MLDQLIDGEFDWVEVVRSYPIASIGVAALGGFLLGRNYGVSLFDGVTEKLNDRVKDHIDTRFAPRRR